ncbi:unnamed protein product [Orchesella dallaii]|uniref:Uncharacterized protein n=1 Tax=Orchesella dallaii TaxID=48710 RepID=A0ABP1RZG9_9HEXA
MEETARSRRPPVPLRRSTRQNFGVAPNFLGDPVMGWRRQPAQRQEATRAPLSSTKPFIDDIDRHEDDRHSTASSSTRRRQQELELQRIKFQIELNDTKMEQMKLFCKQTFLQMEMLNDEVEDGEILSDEEIGSYEVSIDDEFDKRLTIDDWLTTEKTVEPSAIPITDKDNPHYVPTPKPRKGITKNTNPFAAFPPQPPITTATIEPHQPSKQSQWRSVKLKRSQQTRKMESTHWQRPLCRHSLLKEKQLKSL